MKKVIIIGSGQYVPMDELARDLLWADKIIAVDGGMNFLRELNIEPDVFLGDQDSTRENILDTIDETSMEVIKFKAEKDKTDMELAIDYVVENNFDEVIIYGSTGTRLDHSFANILLLRKLMVNKIKAKILDLNNEIYLVDDVLLLDKNEKKYISVVPITNDGVVVSLFGFKYPLDEYLIGFSETIGVSNEILDERAKVKIHSGEALVFVSKD